MSELDLSARARALTKNLENLKRHHSTIAKANGKLAIGNKRDSNSSGWEQGKLEKLESKIKELEKLEDKIKNLERADTAPGPKSDFEQQLLLMEQKLKEMERALATKDEQLKNFEDKSSKLGQMDELLKKLEKVDQIDTIYKRLEIMEQRGYGGGGGGSGKSGDELKKEIEEVQKIIMDEKSTEKEKADANIRMEKLMEEYEKTPEFRAEIEKQKEEKVKKHEPLNRAALEKMKRIYTPASIVNDTDLYNRVQKYPELKLIALEPNIIMKMHESDYRTYSLASALTIDELRAIRANLPKFRRDQKVQMGFLETLDNKIEERSNRPEAPAAPKKAAKKLNLPKPTPGGGGDTGGLFAELLRKRGAIAAAAGDDDSGSGSSAPASFTPPAPVVYQPPPPPPANCPPPPPLPSNFAPPPPPPPFAGMSAPPPPPPPSSSLSGLTPPPPPPSLPGITAPAPAAAAPAPSPIARREASHAPPKPIKPPAPPSPEVNKNATLPPQTRSGSQVGNSLAPPAQLSRAATAPVDNGSPAAGVRKLKAPTEMPPKEQIAQLKLVKDSLQALLNGLKNKDDARQIAAHTKSVVANIMNLAAMGKPKYPAESAQLETRCTELVQTVKEVLSSKAGLDKFEASVANLTQNAAMTLGYTLA